MEYLAHKFYLRPTYFKMGFFNVPVAASKYYGRDKESIEIYCGDSKEPIIGYINRNANKTDAPRIMGAVKLRDWFQNNFEINDEMKVTIVNSTKIRIHKA